MKRFLFLSLCGLLVLSSCLQLRPISLYDGQATAPPPPKPEAVSQFVSPLLFADDTLNIWGIVSDSCKNFSLEKNITYRGKAALRMNWNRAGCEWIGFGMGWDDYAGKNLEPLLPHAAFEMYVRTEKGKAFGLPMVFTLEDYSGVMAFCYTANSYFERYYLDEEWQKVLVPLSAFNDEGEGIDYTNIKQLQIEMQQSGAVIVDEIRLVLYEKETVEPWMAEPSYPDPTQLPQALFEDGFVNDNGWGLVSNDCQTVEIGSQAYAGAHSIHVKWDNREEDCKRLPFFGVSWSHWMPVDIRPMVDETVLRFYLKADDLSKLEFQVYLEDFNRNVAAANWEVYWGKPVNDGWYQVNIPMKSLLLGQRKLDGRAQMANASDGSGTSDFPQNLDLTQVKSINFRLQGQGEMWIDDMKWERRNSN